jgi:rod shape-determining protein MreC
VSFAPPVAVLRKDGLSRDRPHFRGGGTIGLAVLLVLTFFSGVLLILERVEHKAIRSFRGLSMDVLSPVMETASQPVYYAQRLRRQVGTYLDLMTEMDHLKAENQQLKQWRWRAQQLETEAREYRKLLLAVDDSSYGFATGRVIADGRSPFIRTTLINIGRAQGVTNGYAVVDSEGFVGRIVETGEHSARVLLFTDINSRIPVEIGPEGVRAIMRGDTDGAPVIEFLPSDKTITAGDDIKTSGQDGLLPRGLPVGRVIKVDQSFRVVPRVRLDQVDFASVLFYAAPGLELAGGTAAGSNGETVAVRAK